MNGKKLSTKARLKSAAMLLVVASLFGRGYAERETKRRIESRRHGFKATKGAFGGPKRAGAKLLKRMVKAGLKDRMKAHRTGGR